MHFLTLLTLGTSVTAAVAGGRKPTRWNQRGPVNAGHGFDTAAEFKERAQDFAHVAREAGKQHMPFKLDDEEDGTFLKPKGSSGLLKGAWNKVNHKAREAVELAKAQAAKRDVDDEDAAIEARGGDAVRAKYWSAPPRPAKERLGQRDVDGEYEDEGNYEDEDEDDYDIHARDARQHGDAARVKGWHPPARPASERLGQRDVDVDEGDMSDYDDHLVTLDPEDYDDEYDEDDEDEDEPGLVVRDTEDTEDADDVDNDDDDDDVDAAVDFDDDEDDLAAHMPEGEDEAQAEEDTLDDTAGLTARDADPEPRRLFHFGKHMSKVASMVYGRSAEDDEYEDYEDYEEADLAERGFFDGTMPTGSIKTAPAAPVPQPAHETNGWGKQHGHGHGHYHHAAPEPQAGPTKTRTQGQNWF